MKRIVQWCIGVAAALCAGIAGATFHTWVIEELYSNADGSVQYLVLHDSYGADGENLLGGRTLVSTRAGVSSTYTFPGNLPGGSCGYYGCSPAPTADRRVLIATQGFAALGFMPVDYTIPNGFLPLAGGTVNYADVDVVSYASLPTDGVHALDRGGNSIVNVATGFSGRSMSIAPPYTVGGNFQGLWWASPGGSESGWGVNLNHQGTTIFATWFTFGLDGKPLWLAVTLAKSAPGVYAGTLYEAVSGPAFNAVPFVPAQVVGAPAGDATLTFSDGANASFAYSVDGIAQTRAITREIIVAPGTLCL